MIKLCVVNARVWNDSIPAHHIKASTNGFGTGVSLALGLLGRIVGMSSKCRGKISPHKSAGVHECVRYTRYNLVRMSFDENGA